MEDAVIVIMLKDAETGFLEKELGSYTLPENSGLIFNIYAENEGKEVVLRLSCDKELLAVLAAYGVYSGFIRYRHYLELGNIFDILCPYFCMSGMRNIEFCIKSSEKT